MHQTERRHFLKAAIGTAVAVGSPSPFAACRELSQALSPTINARVAAIRGDNLDSITREAIDALGGMNAVVNHGEIVFIKPNFVSFPWPRFNKCFHTGECTKPEILIAVAEECLKAGAREVIIGEGSHRPKFDWQYAVTLDGKTTLVKEAGRLSARYHAKVMSCFSWNWNFLLLGLA